MENKLFGEMAVMSWKIVSTQLAGMQFRKKVRAKAGPSCRVFLSRDLIFGALVLCTVLLELGPAGLFVVALVLLDAGLELFAEGADSDALVL